MHGQQNSVKYGLHQQHKHMAFTIAVSINVTAPLMMRYAASLLQKEYTRE
jgi:creatinine amidohydrolase/Fe(II)-dependent formamide hydrolase-like protein